MGNPPIQHFLIVYRIDEGRADVEPYGTDYQAALDAYEKAEADTRDDANLDIVLVGAEDLEIIKRTHSSYFDIRESFESLLPEGIFA